MQLNGFIGPSYTLQSTAIECQRSINLYPQTDESGVGKNIAALIGTPGLKLFCNLSGNPIRALFTTAKGRVFAVSFTSLYELNADGSNTVRGALMTQAGRVGIADNGSELMIVDGPFGYSLNLATNALTQIAGFPGGGTVAFQDSYFVFNVPNTQQFYISGTDATTVDPLDFASKEGSPDNILCVLSVNRSLWIFGADTTEVWFNSGAELFPFSRIDGVFIEHGTASPYAPCIIDNTVAWLSQESSGTGIVYAAVGYQPSRISTFAMEQEIARYPTLSDVTSYSYQQDGHPFYVLNFPSGNATWVYDFSAQLWHERAFTTENGFQQRHRADTHTVGFGKHLVGDWETGKVYQLDTQTYTDNGAAIARIRTSPYVSNGLKNLFISSIQLSMATGLQPDGDAPVPQCMLQWSDDGGGSWSNEYWVSLGKIGATYTRAIWRRLGRTRQRVFRVKITDAVPVAIIDALIEVEAGTS
jgi:hypothetical protein